VTCRRSDEIDLPGYFVDPTAPASAEFRAHYPTCPDCSRAVASWANLEAIVKAASANPEPAHPPEELLLAFQNHPERLRPEDGDSIRLHLEACLACRDDLAALASFDFASLEREYSTDAAPSSTRAREPMREGLLPSLRDFFGSLSAGVPVPARAMALFLIIAIPSGLALWWMVSGQSIAPPSAIAPPSEMEVASTGSEAEATVPSGDRLADSPSEIEVPSDLTPPSSLALAPPDSAIPGLDPAPDVEPGPGVGEPIPRSSEAVAEAAMPAAPRVAEAPPSTAEAMPPVAEPPRQVIADEAPPGPDGGAEAQETEVDQRALLLAMASLDPPRYAMPSFAVGPARTNVVIRRGGPELPVLRALVPDHTGLTLRESPVLYWFVSASTEFSVEFSLVDDQSINPALEFSVDGPVNAGIHAVDLSDHAVRLAPGVPYRWFVSISTDEERSTHELVSGGVIERIELAEPLRSELDEGNLSQRGHTLAANGIWYDALDFVSGWIDQNPAEASLREQRAALLEQVGLPEVARYERHFQSDPSAE
jgi:anti-sigma factor RsiW